MHFRVKLAKSFFQQPDREEGVEVESTPSSRSGYCNKSIYLGGVTSH